MLCTGKSTQGTANAQIQHPTTWVKSLLGVILVIVLGTFSLTAWAETFPGKGSRAKWEEAAKYSRTGIRQAEAGDYKSAKTAFQKAINIYDQDPAFYSNLGLVYRKMNQLNQAEYYYNQALRVNPAYGRCWINLGYVFVLEGKLPDALNAYRMAGKCDLSPKFRKDLELGLAEAQGKDFYKRGDYDKAIMSLDKWVALNNENGEAYYLRGKTYEKLGKTSEAQSDFARSKELDYKPKQSE